VEPPVRKSFQGTWNIIRFNWPHYILATISVAVLIAVSLFSSGLVRAAASVGAVLIAGTALISLLVSFYVYDLSGFYRLGWLDALPADRGENIVNINAGFDEISRMLKVKYPDANLHVCDFYDTTKHTEPSILRARKAYPPHPKTQKVSTTGLPFAENWADKVFAIMSAHEIRDAAERESFFRELSRILTPSGRIVVVEHTRDAANFLAYNIGAFHFHPKAAWITAFDHANLEIEREIDITPFLTAFILTKNGTTS
jgi:SAM-dependent methyltransferase